MARKEESITGKLDWLTVMLYALLAVLGWFIIYSASSGGTEKSILDYSIPSGKQFQWMIASVVVAFIEISFTVIPSTDAMASCIDVT